MNAFTELTSLLIAEDDEDDRMLIQKAFETTGFKGILSFATNGEETLHLLRHQIAISGQLPDLILLDLNMPRKNGYEVIQEMQTVPFLALIPIIVLSTAQPVKHPGCTANIQGLLTKPSDFTALVELIRSLPHYCTTSQPSFSVAVSD